LAQRTDIVSNETFEDVTTLPGAGVRLPSGNDQRLIFILRSLFGWFINAYAVSLDAPFWFGMLNKFIVIRSAAKPHEKSQEDASKN
jgi:hypothetical protein